VGSTRLPLRSIAENTIGQKLSYEAINQENELPPLFAAIRSNTSIRVMSVVKMKGNDILKVCLRPCTCYEPALDCHIACRSVYMTAQLLHDSAACFMAELTPAVAQSESMYHGSPLSNDTF
jgi:hypothetical protein